MKTGDVITAINGDSIASADDLTAKVNTYKPGDKVTVTVNRNGSTKKLTITLGTRPS